MLVLELKLGGQAEQYSLIDEAIRAALFVRNSCIRYWIDNEKIGKYNLSAYCKVLELIVYEDLQVRNMVKNRKLAKSISDASWSLFREWLEYFGKVFGKATVAVAPQYTSQNCSNCGNEVKKALSERTHQCPHCGTVLDRDHNAALNILAKGLTTVGHTGSCAWGQTDLYLDSVTDQDKSTG